jgi:2-iminobutanoate/2-iminopropanoate deaminase
MKRFKNDKYNGFSSSVVCSPSKGSLVFMSGVVAFDRDSYDCLLSFEDEAKICFNKLEENLMISGGLSLNQIVKITVFIKNIDKYETYVKVRNEIFGEYSPAATCVVVSNLLFSANIEIEAHAFI